MFRQRLVALVALVSLGGGLVACGSDSSDGSASTTAPAVTGPAVTEPPSSDSTAGPSSTAAGTDSSAAPASTDGPVFDRELDREATLRVAYPLAPSRFDPHKATSGFDATALNLTYDRLVHISGSGDPVPGLAVSWDFSDDGLVLTMNLREGVVFHDGELFDAEVVKANIERGQTVEGSAVAGELAVIDSVTVVDDYTVELNLNGPAASLPLVLSERPGMMLSPAAFDKPDLDVAPSGSGMYEVVSNDPGAKIVYERFPDYWDDNAGLVAKIEFLIQLESTTRLNALRSGQIDWAFVDPMQAPEAEAAGLTVFEDISLSGYHLQFNQGFEPLQSLQVRQAINHAIDRQAIVDGLIQGHGQVGMQIFPDWYFGYDDTLPVDYYAFDQDKARDLLTEAGYPDGFEFDVLVPTVPDNAQLGEVVQAMLAEVGITMQIVPVPAAQIVQEFYIQQSADALVAGWGPRPDPSMLLGLFYSETGFSNPGGRTTPAMSDALNEALKVQSPESRVAAVRAASRQMVLDALDTVLYFPTVPVVQTDRVVGTVDSGLGGNKPEFRNIGIAK